MDKIVLKLLDITDEYNRFYFKKVVVTEELSDFFIKIREKIRGNARSWNNAKTSIGSEWYFNKEEIDYLIELINKYNQDIDFHDKFNELLNEN